MYSDRPKHFDKCSKAEDVWAIGALLFMFFFRRGPFQFDQATEPVDDRDEFDVHEKIVDQVFEVPVTPTTSKSLKKFLKSIFSQRKPEQRITLLKLRGADWLLQDKRSATPPAREQIQFGALG